MNVCNYNMQKDQDFSPPLDWGTDYRLTHDGEKEKKITSTPTHPKRPMDIKWGDQFIINPSSYIDPPIHNTQN